MRVAPPRSCIAWLGLLAAISIAHAAHGQVTTYHISRAPAPPAIDGRLDDACWKSACTIGPFRSLAGKVAEQADSVSTKAMLTYDADHLYVAYLCEEPHLDKLQKATTEHDGPTWKDDAAEIFFNPSGDRNRYCQIAVNAAGVVMDNYGLAAERKLDTSYETGATAAGHVDKAKGRWTLEVQIPFAGLPVERLDCPWTFHLARHRATVPQLYTSLRSPVMGFHEVQNFDVLEGISLSDGRPAVLNVRMGDMLQGTNVSGLTLANGTQRDMSAVVWAGIERAVPPCSCRRTVIVPASSQVDVTLPWELRSDHAGRTEGISVVMDGRLIRRRQRRIAQVPPVFGRMTPNAYYLDPNECVPLRVPIQLASGSRGEAQLSWTATDAAGAVKGRGLTTVCGESAVVRLYWPRWAPGRFTLDFKLTRDSRDIASHRESVRLVQSPWGGF